MLKKNILLILCLLATQFYAQNAKTKEEAVTYHNQKMDSMIEIKPRPILTEEFERLDVEKYWKIGVQVDAYGGRVNNELKIIKNIAYTKLENGKYIDMWGGGSTGYHTIEIEGDSFYEIYKNYYLNGNIKSKRMGLNFSSSLIGKVYKYNEKGELIHAFAEDTQYKFSIEQVLKYLLEVKKLPLETGYLSSSSFTKAMHIEQSEMDDKHVWLIKWEEEDPAGVSVLQKIITLFLDGDTGAFISKEEELYDPNPIMIEYPFGE